MVVITYFSLQFYHTSLCFRDISLQSWKTEVTGSRWSIWIQLTKTVFKARASQYDRVNDKNSCHSPLLAKEFPGEVTDGLFARNSCSYDVAGRTTIQIMQQERQFNPFDSLVSLKLQRSLVLVEFYYL